MDFGASWGAPGHLLGRLGGVFVASWGRLGASWGRLGRILARLGSVLNDFQLILASKRDPRNLKNH